MKSYPVSLMEPLVSIILLCHNQAVYIAEAFRSVVEQEYPNIQLIVVDDASTDRSPEVIKNLIKYRTEVPFIRLKNSVGNCQAFNAGLQIATGKYVIDLAADDVLMPDRVNRQVKFFEQQSEHVGVIYSNASYIDESGKFLSYHFKEHATPPQGDIYTNVVSTYFIPPPAMMIRKSVLDKLNGYDGQLAYEDFDFWVRSARFCEYAYQPLVLTAIRKVSGSLSSRLYQPHDRQLHSTYLVCRKIKEMNKTFSENDALIKRLKYEIKHAVLTANFREADLMLGLFKELAPLPAIYRFFAFASRYKIDLRVFRNLYYFLSRKPLAPKTHF